MKIAIVTDAWSPQVNGVVTTLVELVRELRAEGHQVQVVEPGQFRTRPCPGYDGIALAIAPARGLADKLDAFGPDAIHLATEGPLGWAGRRYCLRAACASRPRSTRSFRRSRTRPSRSRWRWGMR